MAKVRSKKCKVCEQEFIPRNRFQKACSIECAIKLSRKNAQEEHDRAEKKKLKERKIKLKSRAEWLREAQEIFNKFIRLRDKNEPCISCGRYHQGQWHAGHYRSVGACPELRFCELNVWKQCSPCNNHKSGNAIEYRINLVKRIGAEKSNGLSDTTMSQRNIPSKSVKKSLNITKPKLKS